MREQQESHFTIEFCSVEVQKPHASPMISEPKLGRINSALETMPNSFMVSNMLFSRSACSVRMTCARFS